jgi:hypothetical protein
MAEECPVVVRIKHGAALHEVALPASSTVGDLQRALALQVGVPVAGQKLIVKGRNLHTGTGATLAAAGLLQPGVTALLLGKAADPLGDALGQRLTGARDHAAALADRLAAAEAQVAAIAQGHVDGVRGDACRAARKALLLHEERLLQALEGLDAIALGPEHAVLRDLRKTVIADISVRVLGLPL